MEFSKRMDLFNEGVFTKLLKIKQDRLKNNEEVIDLSVGTPNIPPAQHIIDALCHSAAQKESYVYAISDSDALLEAVMKWYKERYNIELDTSSEICSLLGSQEGLGHISMTIVDEGDTVLVPDPCYPIFSDGPLLAGGHLEYMKLKKENNYEIQFDDIPEDIAKKAKLMIVSYPNNPTASMASPAFYKKLIEFAKKYNIIVLHDNAYSELVFDGELGGSFLQYEGAKEVGVEFNSLSKSYGLAGARIGFCLGNKAVVEKLKCLKSNIDYGMFLPIQAAAIAAISGDQQPVKDTCKKYEERRDLLCKGFASIGWHIDPSPATMFVWGQIPQNYKTSESFAMDMIHKAGVLVTPGNAFGPSGEGFVRMALVQDGIDIQKAIDQVKESGILNV